MNNGLQLRYIDNVLYWCIELFFPVHFPIQYDIYSFLLRQEL